MKREQILSVLCDLAFTIGGEVSPQPLMTKTLQRFLYHTGFPVGLMLAHEAAPDQAADVVGTLEVVIGDYTLQRRQGGRITVPGRLLAAEPRLIDDAALLAPLGTRRSMAVALSLPVKDFGHALLLSPRALSSALPLTEIFVPVLPRFATAITLCREHERQSESRRRILVEVIEQSPVSIVITDAEGVIEYVNACFCETTGFARDEVIGDNPRILQGGAKTTADYAELWRTIRSGRIWRGEFLNKRKDGSLFWERAVIAPVREVDGAITHFVGVKEDITEKRAKEEELRRLIEHLTETNTELARFAYVASHDLREPLRTITSFAQLLGRRYHGRLDAEADEFIGFVVSSAKRMDDLIRDLLVYSGISVKGSQFKPVAVAQAAEYALLNLRESIEEAGAVVEVGPLPTIEGDEVQITQLLQNLIGNAVKFRREDVKPIVRVSAEPCEGGWLFTVADNGIGIEPTEQDVFEIFRRLHPQSRYPGTGVGLAICKRIVERHGGRIWYEPNPGGGAAFRFSIGVTAGALAASPSKQVEPAAP
ncbi:MAG: sensor histidine kinase [Solirubrobacterales bacterium]